MSLEQYGEIYENRGVRYFRLPESKERIAAEEMKAAGKAPRIMPYRAVGINVNRIRAYAGTVESFDRIPESEWYAVKVSGLDKVMVIHERWVHPDRYLKVGDELEGVLLVNTAGYVMPLPDVYGSWHTRKANVAQT